MNSIYKVIWSKAKNCYVVASEIARSHTKSASGSEKIGGIARHALLALGAACAIACGGFVNVGAAESVDVPTIGGSQAKVYTKDGTESYVNDKVEAELRSELNYYYKKSDVDARLEALTTTGDVATNKNNINDLKIKAESTDATLTNLSGRMVAAESDIDGLQADMATAKSDINTLKADVSTAKSDINTLKADVSTAKSDINTLKAKDTELSGKIDTETANRITSDTALDHKIDAEIANRITSDTALDHKIDAEIANRITSDTALDQKIDKEIQDRKNDIKATNDRTGGIARNLEGTQTTIEGIVKVDNQGNVKDVKGLSAETITTTGNASIGGDLKVAGTITTDKMVFGDKATQNYTEIDHGKVTSKNLEVNGAGETISSSSTFNAKENKVGFANSVTGEQSLHKQTSDVITDNVKNNITGDQSFHKQTSDIIMDNVKDLHNSNNRTQTKTETKDIITDENGNSSTTSQTASENKTYLKDKDGKNTNSTIDTAKGYDKTIKGENGETSTKQDELNITNTAQKGTITNDAKDIVNNASGNMTNTVGGKLTTTVTGATEENYNGGLTTNVTGEENHTVTGKQNNKVTGKQTNTVEGGQENIISGGQTNTITGGQINNITGDQTTTITGNKTETVTENVTEDYKKNLTTTVGGNEIHEVKGTKTETVEGKLTENFKGGQETNVTGDQTTNVSGTQTTTATDIKRNASSGMIDTIDNDYGTNTETKVAGKTTTDVSIKGTGEKGQYIRGANESRDYLIKGTLKNEETKTAEVTSTEITDGTNKASTIQDAKNLAGSVTNGMETGVSGIHANDDGSVSIDSAVAGGGMSSVINQKKDSIQSAVGDGTNSTVIHQDKDNVTIASSNGMVGLVGKDIVNNAQDTITNTAGTSITNQVNDSKVTTDANGTTFENNTLAVSDGGATTTKINGNQITTGRVNANELAVSDKDGDNTADLSVKAGEDGGVKASAGNGTTTGSLDVKADKVTTSIKSGSKENTVTSTADGTIFSNSEANTVFEGGRYTDTTIKGNTITTGKVTMDYAEVMKDLGVTGKTTTGSLEVKGESKLTGKVTMESDATVGGTLDVTKKATFRDDVDIKKNLSVVGDVTASSYKVGDKTYISAAGINANDQKITNVADGSISEGSKDAVNGGQLYGVKRDLEHQVDKVGANAAAMANLRPMEFDPSSKWNIAAAIGNYGSETAAALGAFYRPNDDVMVNLSTAFGTGENMVGGGVSVRLGKGSNKLSREENNALKAQVDDLTARMDALLSVLNPNMSKDFPDVPENHWAYEAVSRLAGNDIVQGYPDGEFHGERTMTRYEMAEIIYNALSRGAEAEKELVEEFKPELQAMAASEKSTAEKAEG